MNLVNSLINTQSINEEILINNEIKTESECLKSLLNIKQEKIMNQINQNNNNFNPLMFQNFPNMNLPNQMIQNNNNLNLLQNNNLNNDEIIYVSFVHDTGKCFAINCKETDKISDMINQYRLKSKDYNKNNFICNGNRPDPSSTSTIGQAGIKFGQRILVYQLGNLPG